MSQLELNLPITFDAAAAALTINENITSQVQGIDGRLTAVEQSSESITSTVTKLSGISGENLLVNSSFQVSEGKNMPEKWSYYNENTIITPHTLGSVNYININNNNYSGRGIAQNSTDRYNNTVQDFYPNHIYCFSFYGKKNSTYGEISCFIHYLDSSGNMLSSSLENQTYQTFELTNSWSSYDNEIQRYIDDAITYYNAGKFGISALMLLIVLNLSLNIFEYYFIWSIYF